MLLFLALATPLVHLFFRDRLFWGVLVPLGCAQTLADPVPLLAGGLVGALLGRLSPRSFSSRCALGAALGGCVAAGIGAPFLGPPPPLEKAQHDGPLVRQTHGGTCGAASAATLLRLHGIAATEESLVRLCGTRASGTARLALWRGLLQATEGTPLRPRALLTHSVEALRGESRAGPILLFVDLDRTPGILRAQHAVVLLGFLPEGSARIADPLVGETIWTAEELAARWHGEGLMLEKKP
jgi:hypothetical protein